jgi:hypothetical protein
MLLLILREDGVGETAARCDGEVSALDLHACHRARPGSS